jgi:hypothetical protein
MLYIVLPAYNEATALPALLEDVDDPVNCLGSSSMGDNEPLVG